MGKESRWRVTSVGYSILNGNARKMIQVIGMLQHAAQIGVRDVADSNLGMQRQSLTELGRKPIGARINRVRNPRISLDPA